MWALRPCFSLCSRSVWPRLRFALQMAKTAQCNVTHRIRIFEKNSEHVKIAKSAVSEGAVTYHHLFYCNLRYYRNTAG